MKHLLDLRAENERRFNKVNMYNDGVYKVIEISKEKLRSINLKKTIVHSNIDRNIVYLCANTDDINYINTFLNLNFKIWDDITFDYFKLIGK